jgi:hypothetical protein
MSPTEPKVIDILGDRLKVHEEGVVEFVPISAHRSPGVTPLNEQISYWISGKEENNARVEKICDERLK